MANKPSTSLVKLSRPRLLDAVPRPRLYAQLDALLLHPLVWIAGPPGAGKTTLVATYLESRKLPCLWYQMDSGDADPATLFHYLTLAVAEHSRGRATLPRFASEYLVDLHGFGRRFFRDLFSQLRASSVLVFDNFEDVGGAGPVADVLRVASNEIPPSSNLLIVSRVDPPPAFTQLIINRTMATLDTSLLRFSADETRAVARQAGVEDERVQRALHEKTDGWAAGVRLLAEHARRGASLAGPEDPASREELFDYFAEQVFAHTDPGVEKVLVQLALLPRVTADIAREVSGSAEAGAILDGLARRHLFVERRAVTCAPGSRTRDGWTYQFHKLFHTFLREHANRVMGADAMHAHALHAARVMEACGCVEEAIGLYLDGCEWDAAVRLLHGEVPRLLQESRSALLLRWIALLPAERRDADPWLLYWSGCACAGQDPAAGRAYLERAHALAGERSDRKLAALTAAAIVETFFLEYTRFAPLDRWITVLEAALAGDPWWTNPEQELRARSALLSATLYRRGDPPELAALAARTLELLHEDVDADLKLAAGAWLLSYGANLGKLDFAARALPIVEPLLSRSDLSPLRRGLCAYFAAWCCLSRLDRSGTETGIGRLQRMGQEVGLPMLERFAIIISVWADIVWHPQADLARWIHAFERVMDGSHPYDVATLHAIRAWCSLARGDPVQGQRAAHAALDAYEQVGSPWHRLLARGMALWSAVQLGDHRGSDALAAEIRRLAAATNVRVYDLYIAQANAWLALESGSAARLAQCLRELFTRAAVFGTAVPPRFIPAWMPRLAAAALQAHIEAPYVRTLIKAYAWPAPGPESVEWPFPVRVRMLGRFEIEVDDLPVCFPSKAPRKTLALLKALICMGGKEVRDHQLIDALWPDEEADAARTVFGVTLHRLRRLLGGLETIEVSEGCVSINLQRVWVDVIAFERVLSTTGAGGEPDARSVLRALSLYAGPLLPGELDAPWSAAARERLRAKFVHHLAQRGRELESHAEWDEAIALYLRGLDADSLNESFYQGLMRAYYLSGRRAEGMSLYGRLREALAAALGIEPSMQSQAMFRRMSQSLPLPGMGDGRRNGSTGD